MSTKYLLLTVACMAMGIKAMADDGLRVSDVQIEAGQRAEMSIELTSETHRYTAFAFDLRLPLGISIAKGENGSLMVDYTSTHTADNGYKLFVTQRADGCYRVVGFHDKNQRLVDKTGTLLTLTLEAAPDIVNGEQTGSLTTDFTDKESGDAVLGVVGTDYVPSAWYSEADAPFAHTYGFPNAEFTITMSNPSGIHDLPNTQDLSNTQHLTPNTLYNLLGQKVTKAGRGIYIINGKKILSLPSISEIHPQSFPSEEGSNYQTDNSSSKAVSPSPRHLKGAGGRLAKGKLCTLADIVTINEYLRGKEVNGLDETAADVNGDGTVDGADVTAIVQMILQSTEGPKELDLLCVCSEASEWSTDKPFMTAANKDCGIMGFINEGGKTVMLLCDYVNDLSYILCPTDKGFFLTTYDIENQQLGSRAIYCENGQQRMAGVFDVDWNNHTLVCDSVVSLTSSAQSARTRRVDSEKVIYETMGNMFEEISTGVSDLSHGYGILETITPAAATPSKATNVISTLFGGVSNHYKGLTQGVTASEYLIDEGSEGLIKYMLGNDALGKVAMHLFAIKMNHSDWPDKMKEDITKLINSDDDEPSYTIVMDPYIGDFWAKEFHIKQMGEPNLNDQPPYKVEVSVSDVTPTSVMLNGSYKEVYPNNATILQMGYVLVGPEGKQYYEAFDLTPLKVSDLQPESEYTAYAYLSSPSSSSSMFMSKGVCFKTGADGIKLSSYLVEFDAEGGTERIEVEAPEGVGWFVSDNPWWVSVKEDDTSITITVPETDEERDGEVVITVYLSNGKKKTERISVFQWCDEGPEQPDIDADYVFTGTLKYKGSFTHWVDGKESNENYDESEFIAMGLNISDEGRPSLILSGEGSSISIDLDNELRSLYYFTGYWCDGEREYDGWRYVVTKKNYTVTDDRIDFEWTVVGDRQLDVTQTDNLGDKVHVKATGSCQSKGSITIIGLQTDRPALEWLQNDEMESERIETTDRGNGNVYTRTYKEKDSENIEAHLEPDPSSTRQAGTAGLLASP